MKVGIDIVDISEFQHTLESGKDRFIAMHFLKGELYDISLPHLAGIYAAKEAVFKTGYLSEINFLMIQIVKNTQGKPNVYDHNGKHIFEISLSISHTKHTAVAVAIYNG